MNKYKHFCYRDLKIVVENNPNDTEAQEQFQTVCNKLRNSNADKLFYLGLGLCIFCLCYLVPASMGYITPFIHKYIMLGIGFVGPALILMNIDNCEEKELLAKDESQE